MLAGSHVIFASATWLLAAHQLGLGAPADPFPFDPVSLGAAIAGSLAPDIDHPKSFIGRRLKPLSVPISWAFGHRGLSHSAWALAACGYAVLGPHACPYAIPFVVGYLSHLAGDLITPAGLALMWPLRRRRTFALPIMKTGSFLEQVFVTLTAGWMFARAFGAC